MNKKIKIAGVEYPIRQTMGAFLRYKRETGVDASALNGDDAAGMVTWIWCCVSSACAADGVEFPYSLEAFADALTVSIGSVLEILHDGEVEKKTEVVK